MKKTLSFFIKLIGLAIAIASSFYVVLNNFIINQPARTTWSISGFLLLGIIFLIIKRYANLWFKTKVTAIETARELNVNGNTSPLLATILKAVYVVLPALLFVLLFYGISKYNGLLWLNTLKLVGTISIYFIFEFVAVVLERYFNKKKELEKLEAERDAIAERVAKKIKFN
jgi:hypothetical protein